MLLVEDGRDAREILTGMLELRFPQMTLHLADNGKTGLDTFREHLPAWVITDLNMPVMSGIRLAEEVKTIASEVKPILLTAFNDKPILESCQAAGIGIDHYLMKPVDCRKLLDAIKLCLIEAACKGPARCSPCGKNMMKGSQEKGAAPAVVIP